MAIGNFDGLHKGHQTVINEAGAIARARAKKLAVMTFEPHPDNLFKSATDPFRLTSIRIKTRLIEALNVDDLLIQHFDFEFAKLSANDFIEEILVKNLAASHVVAGYDFCFGQMRKGNCDTLLKLGREKGFAFTAVPKVVDENGAVYSSTCIRQALKTGNVLNATEMLGHAFELEGRVEHGDARGRQLGFPTANLHLGDFLRPAIGVYAIRAGVDLGPQTKWLEGVANFGRRPTFHAKDDVVLEAHLFDFDGDLYGKHLRVELIDYIRTEQKFDGLEALKSQISKDCKKAREILSKAR